MNNTNGTRNTASGVDALAFNTTGNDNTATGFSALNAMLLNEFLKEHTAFLEEQSKVQKLEAALEAVNGRLKEQDAKIENVCAQLELNKRTPQMVNNP